MCARSAHGKLRKPSGRERRFARDVNHAISKKIVSLPYDAYALEALNPASMKQNGKGKRFRKMLGSWSPAELQKFTEYKAEDAGKIVLHVDPKHASQKRSKRGYTGKNNGHGSVFKCKNCGYELNADLNASRNVEVLGKSDYFRPLSANRCGSMKPHLRVGQETSNKLPKLWRGVADLKRETREREEKRKRFKTGISE
ncbi:RNA-guided endonuclease TnpB family protein [Tardisphaera saccharovorans]